MVALVARRTLVRTPGKVATNAPPWAEAAGLCQGEPFGDQPAAAFCSGVLVDWDLVLTSGHCVRVYAPEDFAVLFGYHYSAPGQLSLHEDDIVAVAQIVDEALDGPDQRPRLDHAWLRLEHKVHPPREPAPLRLSPASLRRGASLISIGAGGGVPMKIAEGASLYAQGDPWFDYFVANTDTSRGASGGGAFDRDLTLLGVLARGGPDLINTDRGCNVTFRQPDGVPPEEEFTYAARALERLCDRHPDASSLCRPACGDPCVALPPPVSEAGGSCQVLPGHQATRSAMHGLILAGALLSFLLRRRPASQI